MGILKTSWVKELFVDAPAPNENEAESTASVPGFAEGEILIAFATQTGAAESIAEATLEQLEMAGIPARMLDFYDMNLDVLAAASQVLFVTSTTFDGDPPDMAEPFRDEAMGEPASLEHLHYGLLGLGDRVYDEFCGFGHRLDNWLRDSGAKPWFDMLEVDDEDDDAISRWHARMDAMTAATGREAT